MALTRLGMAVLISLVFILQPAPARSSIVLHKETGKYSLGKNLTIYEDKEGKLTIREILKNGYMNEFKRINKKVPSFGFTKSIIWVKFEVTNLSYLQQRIVLEDGYPHHDIVKAYIILPGSNIQMLQGGDSLPYRDRIIAYRNILFPLDLPADSTITIIMRFESESSMQLPLTLWRPEALIEKINREQTFLGAYFGLMLGMFIYNLFLFLFLRDKNYLFYVLYIISFVFAQLGVARIDIEYLWVDSPVFANVSHPMFFNLTFFFGCLFCKSFLDTRKNLPLMDKAIIILMIVSIVGVALSLLVGYTAGIMCVVYVTAFLVPVSLLATGVISWVKGIKIARYYTMGWVTFLVGSMIFNLRNMGVIPSVFITDYSPHIGSAIEVVFLSLALADRISLIEKQKSLAQAKTLQAERALAIELERQVTQKNNDIEELTGLLPICASCKKIRDDKGYWQQVEEYLASRSVARFSHGICPDCARKLYPEIVLEISRKKVDR